MENNNKNNPCIDQTFDGCTFDNPGQLGIGDQMINHGSLQDISESISKNARVGLAIEAEILVMRDQGSIKAC